MRHTIILVLLGCAVLLPDLGRLTLERQQELRVALVARDMVEGSEGLDRSPAERWLLPYFQRQVRLKKPPLSYWLTTASCTLAGTSRSPFFTRLPSALAGIGLLLVTFGLGRRLLGAREGFIAAAILALSLGFFRHARLAETDITLSFFIALGMFFLIRPRFPLRTAPAAGLALGLAFLTKGPAAIAIPLGTGILLLALGRKWPPRARIFSLVLAIPYFAIVAAPWYLYIWNLPEAQAAVASEANALVNTAHEGNLFYYFYTLPIQFLPWGLLLPIAIVSAWRFRHQPGTRFVLAWFAAAFLILSLTPSKQAHYCVLLLVPSALLVAPWLVNKTKAARDLSDLGKLRPLVLVAMVAASSFLFTRLVYPRVNPLADVPAFLAAAPADEPGQRSFAVGINSAIFEYYLGHLVHNRENAALAFRDELRPGERLWVIDKQKQYPPRELPAASARREVDSQKMIVREYMKP